MKEYVKRRLIHLLESGEYKPNSGGLYDIETDAHCPLGVLVEMAIEDGVFEPDVRTKAGYPKRYLFGVHSWTLNEEIRQYAGLSDTEAEKIAEIHDELSNPPNYSRAIKYIKENL